MSAFLGLVFLTAWPASDHFAYWQTYAQPTGWNWSLYHGSFDISYRRFVAPGSGHQVSRLDLPGLRIHQSRAPDAAAIGRHESFERELQQSVPPQEPVPDVHCTFVSVGLWLPAVILLAAPVWVLIKRGRHHWRCWWAGICLRCDHKLGDAVDRACPRCGCRVPGFPRAAILSVLSLATLAMVMVGIISFFGAQRWTISGANHRSVGIQVDRGRVLICKWKLQDDDAPPLRRTTVGYDRWSYVEMAAINNAAWWEFRSASTEYGGALVPRLLPGDTDSAGDSQAQMNGWQEYEVLTVRFTAIAFPLGVAVLLVSAYPLVAVLQRLFGRRIPVGHCRNCGYNLTANVTGICPECGAAAEEVVNS
jgi:hypothetical protein